MRRLPSLLRCGAAASPVFCAERFAMVGPDPAVEPPGPPQRGRVVFLGTGNSTGTPRPQCLMSQMDKADCRISLMAMRGAPECNRNYRCNPAMLIQYRGDSGRVYNIQVDTGKTYREALLRWYPRFGVPWVDAVVLTHDHADACMGLDELRTVQRLPENAVQGKMAASREDTAPLPVFVSARHIGRIHAAFPYLMPCTPPPGTVARFIAKLDWRQVSDFETFTLPGGLQVMSVPVKHGADYTCQAYVFGTTDRVAYLSDVSEVPPEAMEVLEREPLSLLVVDALLHRRHAVHFGVEDALELARRLRPRRTLLVGMSDQLEHHEMNTLLRKLLLEEGLDVQLAHDGLHVDLEL